MSGGFSRQAVIAEEVRVPCASGDGSELVMRSVEEKVEVLLRTPSGRTAATSVLLEPDTLRRLYEVAKVSTVRRWEVQR